MKNLTKLFVILVEQHEFGWMGADDSPGILSRHGVNNRVA
jgi:hypothetical protein